MFIDWLHRSDLSAHDFLEMKAFSTVFECIRYKRGIFHVVLDSINSFDVLQFWRKNLHLYLSPKKKYIHTHTHTYARHVFCIRSIMEYTTDNRKL